MKEQILFIGLLFQSRDMMHLAHLKTTSYATHKALNEYYDGILDLTDSFVEKYFGINGRQELTIPESSAMDPKKHLIALRAEMEKVRDTFTTDLQNIIDEMLGLVNETLYLLTLG